MVKCMVQGCRNHSDVRLGEQPSRSLKRFFSFPKDQARVKVWLAALRETEREITEQQEICEDHFLRHHITPSGISPDAIPVMPQFDTPVSDWNACEEELSGPAEQIQAAADEDFDDDDDDDFEDYEYDQDKDDHRIPDNGSTSVNDNPEQDSFIKKQISDPVNKTCGSTKNAVPLRSYVALGGLTEKFVQLLEMAPNQELDLNEVAQKLGTRKRRVYDITNVLTGIQLITKTSKNKVKWASQTPLRCFGNRLSAQSKAELLSLKFTEEALDWLIKDCAQQLFAVTDHKEHADSAYVTFEDICQIDVFKDQTIIGIRAPQETKLEVPTPTEESIQIHLKGCRGPIHILTCETEGSGDTESTPSKLFKTDCFRTLEESPICTRPLVSDVSSTATAVQSA